MPVEILNYGYQNRPGLEIGGYGLLFGGDDILIHDENTKYYAATPSVSDRLKARGLPINRPILYEHGQEEITDPVGVIWTEKVGPEGVYIKGKLYTDHPAYERIRQECVKGLLGWSRGIGPTGKCDTEWDQGRGCFRVKSIEVGEWTLTKYPADPRQLRRPSRDYFAKREAVNREWIDRLADLQRQIDDIERRYTKALPERGPWGGIVVPPLVVVTPPDVATGDLKANAQPLRAGYAKHIVSHDKWRKWNYGDD